MLYSHILRTFIRVNSVKSSAFHGHLLAPWHWPMWLGLGLLRLMGTLPHHCGLKVGKLLGWLAYYTVPFRRKVADANLRLCFPEWDRAQRRRVIRDNYASMGMGVYELAAAWFKPGEAFRGLADFEGLEVVEELHRKGCGVILLGGHFTTVEIMGRIFLEHFHSFSLLYRKPNNPVLAHIMTRQRNRLADHVIHQDAIQDFVRILRSGKWIWYAPDQAKAFKHAVLAPFFGEPAISNGATGRIARMGHAVVLPYFSTRQPDGRYRVVFGPVDNSFDGKDPEAEGARINEWVASNIRRAPEQYLWLHKRFKNRGEAYPDVYARPSRH